MAERYNLLDAHNTDADNMMLIQEQSEYGQSTTDAKSMVTNDKERNSQKTE